MMWQVCSTAAWMGFNQGYLFFRRRCGQRSESCLDTLQGRCYTMLLAVDLSSSLKIQKATSVLATAALTTLGSPIYFVWLV